MIQYLKKCEEFTICGSVGDNDSFYAHGYPDNFAIYHIIIKGNVKMARPFESEYVSLDADGNNFVNVKDYLYSKRYYTSSSPYHMFGFNAHEPNQDWDGRLVKQSFNGDDKSWLICFSGKPVINGITMNPLDYAKLDNKNYQVNLNDAIVGIFTRL